MKEDLERRLKEVIGLRTNVRAGCGQGARSPDRPFADLEDQADDRQTKGDLMGVQTVDRAVAILTWVGNSGEKGMRLVDLQRALGLTRPTVHRILSSLIEHGLVACDERTRTYRLGWEAAVLGWSAVRGGYDLREIAQGAMTRLAEETGATALLCACSRRDTVCIDRKAGDYPIKVFTVEVGTRRPLGVGAGSIAVLAAMPEADALAVINRLMSLCAPIRRSFAAASFRPCAPPARRASPSATGWCCPP